jgi:hypothetical protein
LQQIEDGTTLRIEDDQSPSRMVSAGSSSRVVAIYGNFVFRMFQEATGEL